MIPNLQRPKLLTLGKVLVHLQKVPNRVRLCHQCAAHVGQSILLFVNFLPPHVPFENGFYGSTMFSEGFFLKGCYNMGPFNIGKE